jgi:hypothetical protein
MMICVVAAALWLAAPAFADPPHVSYIFPAGGQRGTKVDFHVGGNNLHDKCAFEMLGDGLRASSEIQLAERTVWFEGPLIRAPASSQKEDYPKDYDGHVEIAADATPGVRYWRAWTSQGATPVMRFVVGDLPEVIEEEIAGDAVPVSVSLPVTINGRIFPREDVDVWTFDAPAGRTITCALSAAEIGSPLDARLEIRDSTGRVIAESTGEFGPDPVLRFTTDAAGTYQVRLHDVNFDGLQHFVYRLTVTDGPWIDHVYPLGGRRGTEVRLEAAGQLITAPLIANIPDDALAEYGLSFDLPSGKSNRVLLAVDDLPEQLEAEPNDATEQSPLVAVPLIANGRIDRPGDVDCWAFDAVKGQTLLLEVQAARLGSPLDSVLVIRDTAGKELARNDDASAGVPDSQLKFVAPADGRYVAQIAERFASRGGQAFAYRLRIAEPQPDFQLELPSDTLSVNRDAQQNLQLLLRMIDGFAEPVTISVEGLPAGVTADDVQVKANQPKATLVIKADKTARVDLSRVRVVGRADVNGEKIERTATFPVRRGEPPIDRLLLAVAEPTPFRVFATYEFHFVPRGGTHAKRFTIDRGGYDGPLEVRLADRQIRHLQGITGPTIIVPAGATEFEYPVSLPPWMELGRTSRSILMATGEITDAEGRKHKVCYSSGDQNDQLIVRVSPALLQLTLAQNSLIATPNTTAPLTVQIQRDRTITSPVQLELIVPPHLRDVHADPVTLAADEDAAVLNIRFGSSPGPINIPLVIRATAILGNDRVIGETDLELVGVR